MLFVHYNIELISSSNQAQRYHKMKIAALNFILTLSCLASAEAVEVYHSPEKNIITGCKGGLLKTAIFGTGDTAKSYKLQCNPKQPAAFGSMIYCLYKESSEYNKGIDKKFIEVCDSSAKIELTEDQIHKAYANVTKYIKDVKDIQGFNKSKPIDVPVKYNKNAYTYSFNSERMRWTNINNSFFVGFGCIVFWFVVCCFAAFTKWGTKWGLLDNSLFSNSVTKKIQKYISLPALYKKRHIDTTGKLGWLGLIPTRIESIVIFLYTLYVSLGCGIDIYGYYENDTIWATASGQVGRYVGDRTGIIATFSFLFSFLFAGRNNILIWLTGLKHSSFITFHRWVSRINFILSLVHTVAMYYQSAGIGKLASRTQTYWYRSGIVSMVAFSLAMVLSVYLFRRHYYEIFLMSHFILIAVTTIATCVHISKFGYQGFSWAFGMIWVFDRVVRVARSAAFGIQTAHVRLMSNDTLKIRVPKRGFWKAYPGSYGYVSFYNWVCFWQSHPFSLIEEDEHTVTLHVKVKGGITSYLYSKLSQMPNFEMSMRVSIEGPYGEEKPLHKFDTALLYAGGHGIPSIYAYAKSLALKSNKKSKTVKVYWGIREWKTIDWFYDELIRLRELPIQIVIYISQPNSPITESNYEKSNVSDPSVNSKSEDTTSSGDEKDQTLSHHSIVKNLEFIEFRHGRVDVQELVRSDFTEHANGSIAVVSIAHSNMVDEVRHAVAENVDKVKGQVEYFEELQVM